MSTVQMSCDIKSLPCFGYTIMITWPNLGTINTFIIRPTPRVGKMNQILRCDWLPKWARWSYLARSGLPAVSRKKNFPESHIINPLLTKLVRSRWLGIGLVLFFLASLWTSSPSPFFLLAYGPRRSRGL